MPAPPDKRTRPAATPDALRRLTAASPTTSLPDSGAMVVELAAVLARRWLADHGLATAPVCTGCCTCWGCGMGVGCGP
jgi:hypothetical protein